MNLMKKIFELKVEAIQINLEGLEDLEKPWRTEYEEMQKKIFKFALGNTED